MFTITHKYIYTKTIHFLLKLCVRLLKTAHCSNIFLSTIPIKSSFMNKVTSIQFTTWYKICICTHLKNNHLTFALSVSEKMKKKKQKKSKEIKALYFININFYYIFYTEISLFYVEIIKSFNFFICSSSLICPHFKTKKIL